MVTHQLQVERRTGKTRQPKTDVIPLFHATNQRVTAGQSNLTTGRIAAAHGRFSRVRQVAPMCTPSNACFLEPSQVHTANDISIGSVVFAGLTTAIDRQTDRPTDRPRYPVCNNTWHLRIVLRCGLIIITSRPSVACMLPPHRFLANVNLRSRSLYAVARPSVCLSSVVCNARAPYSAN